MWVRAAVIVARDGGRSTLRVNLGSDCKPEKEDGLGQQGRDEVNKLDRVRAVAVP